MNIKIFCICSLFLPGLAKDLSAPQQKIMDGQTRPLNTALLSQFKFYSAKVKHCLLFNTLISN